EGRSGPRSERTWGREVAVMLDHLGEPSRGSVMARSGLYRSPWLIFLLWGWIAAVSPGAASAAGEDPRAADSRLNQSVTLDLMHVPLSDLCAVMERRSGVPHRAVDQPTGDLLADVVGT